MKTASVVFNHCALLACLIFTAGHDILAQDVVGQSVAPAIKTFSAPGDLTTMSSNSVNLYTGDLSFPINLVSITGRNQINVDVTINYSNASVADAVDTWNLEAPTGVLGLGWSMSMPRIIVDHKQTGTREDDEFYLIENGGANPLVRTTSGSDGGGSYSAFDLKNYQFWKIKFYGGLDKWEIIKEDGTRYVYGDKNSTRSTVQYVVRWDNWIGNSNRTTVVPQTQMATVWNLSEVIGLWGDKITYEYEKTENFVGSSAGQKQTEASYLKKITDVIGRTVVFTYLPKAAQYFTEPHTEQTEPDAYQEFYENKYLDHIDVFDEAQAKYLTLTFGYDVINNGLSTAKMLLKSIEQKNGAGETLPTTKFDYYVQNEVKGYLKTMTYPTGGSVTYDYTQKTIGYSRRDLKVKAPAGYSQHQVWLGDDYAVVAWRNPELPAVMLFVYQWVGEWKEKQLGMIVGVARYDEPGVTVHGVVFPGYSSYKDFDVVVKPDFFGILWKAVNNYYYLYLYRKDESKRGDWIAYQSNVDYGEGVPALLAGDHFVAVGSFKDDSTHPCHFYVDQGNTWREETWNQTGGDHYYTATGNYIIGHNQLGFSGSSELNLKYLTQDRKWSAPIAASAPNIFSSSGKCYWYANNVFAFALGGDKGMQYTWDALFSPSSFKKTILQDSWPTDDNSMVSFVGTSMLALSIRQKSNPNALIRRFDPVPDTQGLFSFGRYYSTTFLEDNIFTDSYDHMDSSHPMPIHQQITTFNPNTGSWTIGPVFDYSPGSTFWSGSPTSNAAGIGVIALGDKLYFRPANGNYQAGNTYTLAEAAGIQIGGGSLVIPSDKFLVYQTTSSTNPTTVKFLKNGSVSSTGYLTKGNYHYRGAVNTSGRELANRNIVVTFLGTFDTSNEINLHYLVNEKTTGQLVDFPVTLVTAVDGGQTFYTSLDYNTATATMASGGRAAMYNEVTTIPGSNLPTSRPNGYTKTFFHNGLSVLDLFGAVASTDLRWQGLAYETRHYNASNAVVAYKKITYTSYGKDLLNIDGTKVERACYIRPTQESDMQDGITMTTTNTYDANTGLLKQVNIAGPVSLQTNFTYLNEITGTPVPAASLNILTPVVMTKKKVNGIDTEATAVRYKSWTSTNYASGVFAAQDQFVWKGTGSPDFSSWDPATTPSADWQPLSKVNQRDPLAGVPVEESTATGQLRSSLLDAYKIRVIAQANGTSLSDLAFTSFEDGAPGNITGGNGAAAPDAKAGLKSWYLGTTAVSRSGLTAGQKYTVSFWVKSNGGVINISGVSGSQTINAPSDWEFKTYTVTGITTLNITKSGGTTVSIDELRICPINARVASFTFHPVFGVTSQTDTNNQFIYNEYDNWGRVVRSLDDKRNIVKISSYSYKN